MANQKQGGKSTESRKKASSSSKKLPAPRAKDEQKLSVAPSVLAVLGGLILLILILTNLSDGISDSATGIVGYTICRLLYGIFGWAVWLIPFVSVYLALVWKRSTASRTLLAKLISAFGLILTFSALFYLFKTVRIADFPRYYDIPAVWKLTLPNAEGRILAGGGLFGTLFGGLLYTLFRVVAWLIDLILLLFLLLVLVEITPARALRLIVRQFRLVALRISEARAARDAKKSERLAEKESEPAEKESERQHVFPEQPDFDPSLPTSERRNGFADPNPYAADRPTAAHSSDANKSSRPRRERAEARPSGIPEEMSAEEFARQFSGNPPEPNFSAPPAESSGDRSSDDRRIDTSGAATVVDAATGKVVETTAGVVADRPSEDLYDILFGASDNRKVMDQKPPVGGSDVNVIPKNPTNVSRTRPSETLPSDTAADSAGISGSADAPVPSDTGDLRPSDSVGAPEAKAEKTSDELFASIIDLQKSNDNDHAGTDPDIADPEEVVVHPEYKVPPITLLHKDTGGINADHSEELKANGIKLVSTLESFKVKTKITNISRGPTITRYELTPDLGVRVRAISNLVDDIALNLATSGVRIEAPIPGKSAVGIEVPNQTPETVYLRDLLENPKFGQASSKITAALGMDVAGDPIFVDIGKMPHLLIAGTTGSGKSICINSLITSLLFRASPEELKLILIDPKKVELGVYNRLPHLLVPVVTQPKKAAGALTWAVAEMERRYEAIEEAGVRDIKGYNRQVEEGDIEGEKMPSVIIVIDELADLMMTASDTVEESICRLAQKARAAGMHLIVGTQRPSVDVITGLIKANIPSRIAFTLKSIADSRTIIDIGGAEKLIGHGDMLYAPVGAMKPIRVQGAYVSDKEVEAVCDFIRDQYGEVSYDQKTLDEIREHEAECELSRTFGSSEDDKEEDPKFAEAVRVGVENGTISTSLLQRNLSLGYGRAAKLIDRMERMGIVSGPNGQKPRNVLITMQEYQEMILKIHD